MVTDGIYYAVALSAAGALFLVFHEPAWFALPLFLLAAFCLYFFRDPDRDDSRRSGGRLARRRQGGQHPFETTGSDAASASF